ncbi:MAG TPA: hemolysin family protein [Candidatus Binataceae bacterium]|nr:hemolysin family protein [Candidatus Binataceae bacterium]
MGLVPLLIALAACIAIQAFFSASEIAVISADEIKVRAESVRGAEKARLLAGLLARRDRLLAAILTSTTLATACGSALLTTFLHSFGGGHDFLAPFILAPTTLVLAESIPKLLALRYPLGFARLAARPLNLISIALAPLIAVETLLSRGLRRLVGVSPGAASVFLTREDLTLLVRREGAAPVSDAILPAERQMISRIFRFTHSEARKVMVPLVGVEAVPQDMTLAGVVETVRREGYSRLPVFDQRIFNIVGVVHVFDLLEAPDLSRPVHELMRPVSYFAEATAVDQILIAMQRTGESLAVVVDEYGGASGIITVEDLLEQVVGEIEDEYDVAEELARVVTPRTMVVAGRMPVADLNERFGLRLPESDDYATIAGLVVERFGHIPKSGEQLNVDDVSISVVRSDARAVRELVLNLSRPLRPELARRR